MIAVDTNLLVYAHRRDSPFNEPSAKVVRELAQGTTPWAIPWSCVFEFFSIVTHPRIYRPPSTPVQAVRQIEAWLESPSLLLLADSETMKPLFASVLTKGQISGGQVHDARIAMICAVNGVDELYSADRDFSRFPFLGTRNPLL